MFFSHSENTHNRWYRNTDNSTLTIWVLEGGLWAILGRVIAAWLSSRSVLGIMSKSMGFSTKVSLTSYVHLYTHCQSYMFNKHKIKQNKKVLPPFSSTGFGFSERKCSGRLCHWNYEAHGIQWNLISWATYGVMTWLQAGYQGAAKLLIRALEFDIFMHASKWSMPQIRHSKSEISQYELLAHYSNRAVSQSVVSHKIHSTHYNTISQLPGLDETGGGGLEAVTMGTQNP